MGQGKDVRPESNYSTSSWRDFRVAALYGPPGPILPRFKFTLPKFG